MKHPKIYTVYRVTWRQSGYRYCDFLVPVHYTSWYWLAQIIAFVLGAYIAFGYEEEGPLKHSIEGD